MVVVGGVVVAGGVVVEGVVLGGVVTGGVVVGGVVVVGVVVARGVVVGGLVVVGGVVVGGVVVGGVVVGGVAVGGEGGLAVVDGALVMAQGGVAVSEEQNNTSVLAAAMCIAYLACFFLPPLVRSVPQAGWPSPAPFTAVTQTRYCTPGSSPYIVKSPVLWLIVGSSCCCWV